MGGRQRRKDKEGGGQEGRWEIWGQREPGTKERNTEVTRKRWVEELPT